MASKKFSHKKSFSWWNLLMLLFTVFSVLLLILSYLADFVSPDRSLIIALSGLMYPYILIINLLCIVYWLVQRHLFFLLPFLTVIAGIPYLMRYYPYSGVASDLPYQKMLRTDIMTYNVQLFGIYKGKSAEDPSLCTDYRDSMLNIISDEKPDILCLQEYYHTSDTRFPTTSLLRKQLPEHVNIVPSTLPESRHYLGNVILSKYPVLQSGYIGVPGILDRRSALYADILIGVDTFRVYNLHLQSIRFQEEDYRFALSVTTVDASPQEEDLKAGSKRILKKLKAAYDVRCKQVDTIVAHVDQSPYPVILCGDFNDTPWSYTYRSFSRRLTDSFVSSGVGRGNTFVMNRLLRFRIDYIFCSGTLEPWGHNVIRKKASDHYASTTRIFTELNMQNKR